MYRIKRYFKDNILLVRVNSTAIFLLLKIMPDLTTVSKTFSNYTHE